MKVEFRDENDRFIHEQSLPFDPRLSPTIELRRRHSDYNARVYEVIPERGHMCLSIDKPEMASLVVYLREVRR